MAERKPGLRDRCRRQNPLLQFIIGNVGIRARSESLRAMLHKIAAGVAQPDAASAMRALGAAIAGAAAVPPSQGMQPDQAR